MVNPLGQGIRIPFVNRLRIILRGLYGFWGIGFWIPLRLLSSLQVPPGLVVPEGTSNQSHKYKRVEALLC